MISARRAALLGLTVPLSPIMVAVLGLWPEAEDAPVEQPSPFTSGAPDGPPRDTDWEDERRSRGPSNKMRYWPQSSA